MDITSLNIYFQWHKIIVLVLSVETVV